MGHRVLLVEDSPTMRQLLTFALRPLSGLTVEEAVDGLDGLKRVQSRAYDLALVDINMPLMDGLKLISLIRQDEKNKDIPIVIISTEGGMDVKEKTDALGVNAYITKPVMARNVLDTVKSLLPSQDG
ncbi:MAG: response regulator [bacterium]